MLADDASPSRTVLLSGGVDSACLLALCAQQPEHHVDALFVDYGQAAAAAEHDAATAIARAYGADLRHARVSIGRIPTGEIPGRNALLVYLAMATTGPTPATIMIGIHADTGYRDCSPMFVEAMQVSLDAHREGTLQLAAPFVTWSKIEVYAYAHTMSIPLELTYSCEAGSTPPCGACPSCRDREALDARA